MERGGVSTTGPGGGILLATGVVSGSREFRLNEINGVHLEPHWLFPFAVVSKDVIQVFLEGCLGEAGKGRFHLWVRVVVHCHMDVKENAWFRGWRTWLWRLGFTVRVGGRGFVVLRGGGGLFSVGRGVFRGWVVLAVGVGCFGGSCIVLVVVGLFRGGVRLSFVVDRHIVRVPRRRSCLMGVVFVGRFLFGGVDVVVVVNGHFFWNFGCKMGGVGCFFGVFLFSCLVVDRERRSGVMVMEAMGWELWWAAFGRCLFRLGWARLWVGFEWTCIVGVVGWVVVGRRRR